MKELRDGQPLSFSASSVRWQIRSRLAGVSAKLGSACKSADQRREQSFGTPQAVRMISFLTVASPLVVYETG